MDLPSEEILKDMEKRCNLELTRNPKALVHQLNQYRALNRFKAGGRQPWRLTDFYRFCKEIRDKWTVKDVHEAIREYQHIWKRGHPRRGYTKEEAIAKLIVDLAQEYILLYEWAMGIKNGWEYGKLKGICLVAINRSMILQESEKEGNEMKSNV